MPCTVPPLKQRTTLVVATVEIRIKDGEIACALMVLCICGLVLLSLHLPLILDRCCRCPAPLVCVAWEMHSSIFRFSLVDGDAAIIQLRCGPRADPRGRPSCPPQSCNADDACFFCPCRFLLLVSIHRLCFLNLSLFLSLFRFSRFIVVFVAGCLQCLLKRLYRWLIIGNYYYDCCGGGHGGIGRKNLKDISTCIEMKYELLFDKDAFLRVRNFLFIVCGIECSEPMCTGYFTIIIIISRGYMTIYRSVPRA